jgi:hypothetical protein
MISKISRCAEVGTVAVWLFLLTAKAKTTARKRRIKVIITRGDKEIELKTRMKQTASQPSSLSILLKIRSCSDANSLLIVASVDSPVTLTLLCLLNVASKKAATAIKKRSITIFNVINAIKSSEWYCC